MSFACITGLASFFFDLDSISQILQHYVTQDGHIKHLAFLYLFLTAFACWGVLFFKTNSTLYKKHFFNLPAIAAIFLISLYVTTQKYADTIHFLLFSEDCLLENATALSFITASILFAWNAVALKDVIKSRISLIALWGLAIFNFFLGLEEISWGQRIFDIDTPVIISQINHQKEINFHNMNTTFPIIEIVGLTFILLFCSLYAFLPFLQKVLSSRPIGTLLPPNRYMLMGFALPIAFSIGPEIFEELVALLFITHAIQIHSQRKSISEGESGSTL